MDPSSQMPNDPVRPGAGSGRIASKIGVVLTQLGTPDAPTTKALRRYLREFLGDRRVVDLPRPVWLPILYGPILTFRPKRSARLYQRVWTSDGSPLMVASRAQERGVRDRLERRFGDQVSVALAMRYGNPSMKSVVERLLYEGCDRLLLLPLYPQYSVATTASSIDAFQAATTRRYRVPATRTVAPFPTDPGYIRAQADTIRRTKEAMATPPELILFSFHGEPVAYIERGDPYKEHCEATTAALVAELGLPDGAWRQVWQSRFGPNPWLEPFLDETVTKLAKEGKKTILVSCPGFVADCLETIDEVGVEAKELFLEHGGTELVLAPCVNGDDAWIDTLARLVENDLRGWIEA